MCTVTIPWCEPLLSMSSSLALLLVGMGNDDDNVTSGLGAPMGSDSGCNGHGVAPRGSEGLGSWLVS